MKKRFFSFVLAFAFILIGVIWLTACRGKKQFSELIIEVNGTEYQLSYNFGDFECGTTPNLSYEVYAKYTDGSKEEFNNSQYLTEYKFNRETINSLPETYEAGNVGDYDIGLSYEHFTFNIYFRVVYASTTYQIAPLSKIVWSYGDEQPELSLVDKTIELNEDCYKYIEKSKVANPNHLTFEELSKAQTYNKDSALKPGEYYLFIMVPQTGIYAETPSNLRAVTVNKMNLVAVYSNPLKVTYDYGILWVDGYIEGNFQIKDLNTSGLFEIQTKNGERVDGVSYTLANPDQELNSTNNGEQLTVNFNFSEGYENSAEYFNLPNSVSVTLEVIKGQFEKPTIREYEDGFDQETPNKIDIYVGAYYASTYYNWSFYVLTITKSDGTIETIDINSESMTHIYLNRPTEQGTYTYTIKLKDTTNYTWEDGTNNEVVKEIVVAGDDITGKSSVFTDLKLLKADGSVLTEEEITAGNLEELVAMTESMRASNLGLIDSETGEPLPEGSVTTPSTAICDTEIPSGAEYRTVSGTCDFGGGSFDDLKNSTEPDVSPYYYTYDASRENTVEMFTKDTEYGVVIEASKLVGNLVGDTLTLTMKVPDMSGQNLDTGLIWVFTFTLTETAQA